MRIFSGLAQLFVATIMAGALFAGLLLPYAAGLGLTASEVTDAIESANTDLLDFSKVPLRSTITDAQGNTLAYVYEQNREYAKYSEISDTLRNAVISVEDRRFKIHQGVDWQGTLRALLQNAAGKPISGGSTITQQLVKNYMYYVEARTPSEKADAIARTPIRKLREAKIALMYEKTHTKNEILEQYLNLVAFGPSTYGAEAAAEHFFGVHADRLTLSQSALLAAMINNPNRYNPLVGSQTDETRDRRDRVLDDMARDGWISAKARDEAKQVSIAQDLNASYTPNGCIEAPGHETNGYFCRYVLDYLQSSGFDYDDIARGGYTITATMDPEVQARAVAAVRATVSPDDPEAERIANVMTVVEPGAGTRKVLALAANRPYGLNADRGETVQRLTTTFAPLGAGDVFKLFTTAAAMDQGLGVRAQVDVPEVYSSPLVPTYEFTNDRSYPEQMTLAEALVTSADTPFVALEDDLGLASVAEMSVALGMRGYLLDAGEVSRPFAGIGTDYLTQISAQRMASFTLGVSPVSPLELANVGGTLDSDGMWCPPTPVASVTARDGSQISWDRQACEQVVPPELAHTLTNTIAENMTSPDGAHTALAQANGWDYATASMSGVSLQYKSAAFLGYTPLYSAAVMTWDYLNHPQPMCIDPLRTCSLAEASGSSAADAAGDDDGSDSGDADTPPASTGPAAGLTGATIPAQTWLAAMAPLHEGEPHSPFPVSDPRYLVGLEATQLPTVVNMTYSEAKALLEAHGFETTANYTTDTAAPANTVIDQEPKGSALPGSLITLTVSSGIGSGPGANRPGADEPSGPTGLFGDGVEEPGPGDDGG